jgi:hydroxypyruvate reductase
MHKDVVMDVFGAALRAVDPYHAVLQALRSEQVARLLDGAGAIYVLGAGKAGAAMARAVEDALNGRITGGLVVVKEGYATTAIATATDAGIGGAPLERVRIVEAGHPVPDDRGASAAAHMLQMASEAGRRLDAVVLCLISGGGSALLSLPVEGVSLADLQTTTQLLLRAGATIVELNAVRKHLSRVAGGQLARAAAPAPVLSLILSDVVGSPLDVIASGPTAPDPTTYADALAVLERYGLISKVPTPVLAWLRKGAAGHLPETPKPGAPLFDNVTNIVVADNITAVEGAARRARELGLDALVISTYVEGEAREVGKVLASVAKEVAAHGRPVKRPGCVLFGGETTVTVRGCGVGGRNCELTLAAALALDGWGADVVVASLATDGGDGISPGAGAIADGTTISRARALGLDAHAALADNDSYTFWERLGDAIVTGPTGTNVNDLMAAFVFRDQSSEQRR